MAPNMHHVLPRKASSQLGYILMRKIHMKMWGKEE